MSRFEALREGAMQIDLRLSWIEEKKRELLVELEKSAAALRESASMILDELRVTCRHEVIFERASGGARYCAVCGWRDAEVGLRDRSCRLPYTLKVVVVPDIDYLRLGSIEPLVAIDAVPWPVPRSLAESQIRRGDKHGR